MKITLELYKSVLLIRITQFVSTKGVDSLNAKFQKLAGSSVTHVIVDISGAMLEPEAMILARGTKGLRVMGGVKACFIVGDLSELCDFKSKEDALRACKSQDATLILTKLKMEASLQEMRTRLAGLEGPKGGDPTIVEREIKALRESNKQLRAIATAMKKLISSVEARSKLIKPDQTMTELQSMRKKIGAPELG